VLFRRPPTIPSYSPPARQLFRAIRRPFCHFEVLFPACTYIYKMSGKLPKLFLRLLIAEVFEVVEKTFSFKLQLHPTSKVFAVKDVSKF
jgi:hypothetical protein